MAEALRYFFRVHSFGNQEGSMGVPQVVETHLGESGRGENLLEAVQDIGCVDWGADLSREDQLLFLPGGIRQKPLLALADGMGCQSLHGHRRNFQSAPASSRLRVAKLEPGTVVVGVTAP